MCTNSQTVIIDHVSTQVPCEGYGDDGSQAHGESVPEGVKCFV